MSNTMTGLILGYLDPGSGSIIFQFIAVAVMSAGVYFRQGIRVTVGRFVGWFQRSRDV